MPPKKFRGAVFKSKDQRRSCGSQVCVVTSVEDTEPPVASPIEDANEPSTSTYKRKMDSVSIPETDDVGQLHLLERQELLNLVRACHFPCTGELLVQRKNNSGIYVHSTVYCNECEFTYDLQPIVNFREGHNMNLRAIFGSIVSGVDQAPLEKFLSILGQPSLPDSFNELYVQKIYAATKAAVEEHLAKNREKALLQQPDGKIAVKFDGSYKTRGFSSKFGVMWLSNADSDQILDFEIKSKICKQCDYFEAKNIPQEARSHDCTANFSGPSTEMERAAGKDLFLRSTDYCLIYKILVSDGDSKTYIDVFDIYGVCDLCKKQKTKFTNINDADFSKWVRSPEYNDWVKKHEEEDYDCNVVFKSDCINHITKNFRKDFETLSKSGVKVPGLKSIRGGSHLMGPLFISKIAKRYRQIIFKNKLNADATESMISKQIQTIRTELYAALYHGTMLENDIVRHQYCPEGEDSWCPFKRGVEFNGKKTHHIKPQLLPLALKIFEKRTSDNYLRRVVRGYNQNSLESLNQLIWTNVSKAKSHGYKRIYIAVGLAMLRYELGPYGYLEVQKKLGLSILPDQLKNAELTCRSGIYAAEYDSKKKKKLFDEKLQIARAAKPLQSADYIPGGCEVPAPSGIFSSPVVNYKGCFVAVACPMGFYVARCTEDEEDTPNIVVSFYQEQAGQFYSPWDPEYIEEVARSTVLMKLSHPVPKGMRTVRELSLQKFPSNELDAAVQKWKDYRSTARRSQKKSSN